MRSSEAHWFRVAAIAEAISWTGLLIGMVFKYLVVHNEIGVHIFGPIHGVLFLAYVVISVVVWRRQPWSTPVGVVALLAGIPPYGTVLFERWATRTGRLGRDENSTAALSETGTANSRT
jgi:integral membrane protein